MCHYNLTGLFFCCVVISTWVLISSQKINLIHTIDEIEPSVDDEMEALLLLRISRKLEISQAVLDSIFLNASLAEQAEEDGGDDTDLNVARSLVQVQPFINPPNIVVDNAHTYQDINRMTKIALRASSRIVELYGQGPAQQQHPYQYIEEYTAPHNYCPYVKRPYCDATYVYRTIDGSCNNLRHTWWGKSETPLKRVLRPAYHDGLNAPRSRAVSGRPLPNPRLVTLLVHTVGETLYDTPFTNLLSHFSQFVAHDITFTALVSYKDNTPKVCRCARSYDSDCANIVALKSGDALFNRGQQCMVTPRSSASFSKFNCRLGAREQLNVNTAWLDLSQLYGNSKDMNVELRAGVRGLLKSSHIKGMDDAYLPFSRTTKKNKCFNIRQGDVCFKTADARSNQNLLLTTMHTMFVREHNRVAYYMYAMNPRWNDERVFQETRRVVIAQYQYILYNEWLPLLIGQRISAQYGLNPVHGNYFYGYNPNLYPNIPNELSTAAFRFGHSLVRSWVDKVDLNYDLLQPHGNISFDETVFKPRHAFKNGGLDALARGCLWDPANSFDPSMMDWVTNHLFEGIDKTLDSHRFSLPALNINRGRDHGLQPYNKYRELCGLNRALTFDDLYNIPVEIRAKLQSVYEHVDDIDLYTGGTSEIPIEGAVLGPTFACILSKTFKDLKFADRFWHENDYDPYTRFTMDQLNEIRKSSMARLLCDNVDVVAVQRFPFLRADPVTNPIIRCEDVAQVSYALWNY